MADMVNSLREAFNTTVVIAMGVGAAAFALGFLVYLAEKISNGSLSTSIFFGSITGMWGTTATILMIGGALVIVIPVITWMVQRFRGLG